MERKEALSLFYLYLNAGKKDQAITAWKDRGRYRVCVFGLYDDKAEILWQDTQRTPFWASESKRKSTFTSLSKLVPDLTPERFDEIAREFANADAAGDIEDRTERQASGEAPEETPSIVARDRMGKPIPQERLDARVMGFLHDPALLHRVKQLIEKGLVADRYRFVLGENGKVLLTFLIALSSSTSWPQNEWMTGTSGFGKTNLAMTTLALMPPGYVKRRAYLTAAGLRYGDQEYKVLFIQEWRRGIEQDARLTSKDDGSYVYEIAGRDPDTGEMTTQVGELPAKTIITTSAERLPSPQMLRRCWLISVDETPELTRQINERKAAYAVGKVEPASQEDLAAVQRAVQLLEPADVLIPYAERLVELAPWDRTRLDNLFDVIRVIAWVHQRQRPRDDKGRIVATPADIYMALRVAWPILAQTLQQLPDRLRKVLNKLPVDPSALGETSRDLARELGISQSTVRGYLSDLINLGYAHEDRMPGMRSKLYWASGRSVELLNTAEGVIQQLKWQEIAAISKSASTKAPPGSVAFQPGYDTHKNVVDPIDGKIIDVLTPPQDATLPNQGKIEEISGKGPKIEELSAEHRGSAPSSSSTLPPGSLLETVIGVIKDMGNKPGELVDRGKLVKACGERGMSEAQVNGVIGRLLEQGMLIDRGRHL